jgi:hypothetical protein
MAEQEASQVICRAVLIGEEKAPALCDEGCEVEP